MRFKAKIDYAALAFMFLYGAYAYWPPRLIDFERTAMHADHQPIPHEILGVLGIFCLLVAPLLLCIKSFPEYYEVRENGLFVRQGWNKNLIPYTTINKFLPLAPAYRWSPAANHILVLCETDASFVVAPLEREKFLAEVSQRCPQLEQRDTKHGLSLQQAIL
ncbi:MAG: hypothetical protein ABSF70_16595 [Terracidiphilus sp.]|jgi:hypothetical protein